MADRRRLVTLDSAGVATTVKDFEDSTIVFSVRDSFDVKAATRKPVLAARGRRYAGARVVGESHDNGEISWQSLVKGATPDAVITNAEAFVAAVEQPRNDLYFEWRPDGATHSTFYEVRGPATWKLTYKWAQFQGALSMVVEFTIPVGPLALEAPTTINIASTTLPAVVQLGTAIGGSAPAMMDLALRTSGGTSPPIFAMVGWTKRPGAPLAGSVAPFGVIEAETGASLATWAVTADANYRGGSGLKATAAGAGSASAMFALDPSVMQSDDFMTGEVDIEVWGIVELAATLVLPTWTLSLQPNAGLSFGAEQFSAEFGSIGKLVAKPSSGTVKRMVKLGTLSMPVDVATPLKWNLKVAASWAAGSTGTCGLDYLILTPARQRALSPTSKANDSSYPKFISSTSDTNKKIRADLSGRVASGAGNFGRDSGLGGQLLELPPGNVDLLLKLSSLVPDDPTSDTTSEQLAHTGVTGTVTVWPRYWIGRGT